MTILEFLAMLEWLYIWHMLDDWLKLDFNLPINGAGKLGDTEFFFFFFFKTQSEQK